MSCSEYNESSVVGQDEKVVSGGCQAASGISASIINHHPPITELSVMPWTQVYAPTPWLALSTLLAGLPILLLLGLLATGRARAHSAALAGLLAALSVAVLFYVPQMPQSGTYWERLAAWTPAMLAAAVNGALFGLMPIGWIVLTAIFLYTLTVDAGQFDIVKHSIAALSDDRRIQALLIAFSFGAFVEGAAGFGTPVAISAALMMGAGFRPLYAAGLALLANTAPVAFGALGTPIITLAEVTALPLDRLSAMAGRQLPFFSLLVPVWLVWVMSGWRGVVGVWPALLVCGGSFALVQFLVSNWHGPWLVDVAGGLASLVALALFLRVWQPRQIWHFSDEQPPGLARTALDEPPTTYTRKQVLFAWVPWALLSIFVFLWGSIPQLEKIDPKLDQVKSVHGYPTRAQKKEFKELPEQVWSQPTLVSVKIPFLHNQVKRGKEVSSDEKTEEAVYNFNWLSATGTGIFLAAVVSACWLRIRPGRFVYLFLQTCYKVRWAVFTIACMLAIAFVTRYSGMDASLGLAFTVTTGAFYPLFAALLGWLGVALTGSDTSSNALFGSLQTMTAGQLVRNGILPLEQDQAAVLLASANSTGGVMGKMIDAQSIVVASVATQQHGQEGAILRFVFWHSLGLALLMGALVLFQAYVWTGSIP
jgi:lactate permease